MNDDSSSALRHIPQPSLGSPGPEQDWTAAEDRATAHAQILAALAALDRRNDELAAAQQAADAARDGLFETLSASLARLTFQERDELAHSLYWTRPELNAAPVAAALGYRHVHDLRTHVGTWPTGILCGRCAEEIQQTSRTGYLGHNVPEYETTICDDCWTLVQAERHRGYQRHGLTSRLVAEAAVVAPQEWWLILTELVLAHPPVTADGQEILGDEIWRGYNQAAAVAAQLAEAEGATVSVADATGLLRSAQAVSAWHPAATAHVVRSRLEATAFSTFTHDVEDAIEQARTAALQRARRLLPEG